MACRTAGDIMPRECSCTKAVADWKIRAGQSSGNGSSVCVRATREQRAVTACVCVCVCVMQWRKVDRAFKVRWGETTRRVSSVNCNSIGGFEEEDEETLLFVSQAILLQYGQVNKNCNVSSITSSMLPSTEQAKIRHPPST